MLMMEKKRDEHNTSRRARDLFIEASASPHFNIIIAVAIIFLFVLFLLIGVHIYWQH